MITATLDPEALRHLVAEAQRGDRRAGERLVREHEGWVRGVIYGITGRAELVDDVAQQVWTQVWERLGSLQDPQRLRPWLYSIARHAAIDAGVARKRQSGQAVHLDAETGAVDPAVPTPVRQVGDRELHRTLLRAVESLPALYREPFVLRHLEDWNYAEIGALLGLPIETVETRLVRARRLLRELLKGKVDA